MTDEELDNLLRPRQVQPSAHLEQTICRRTSWFVRGRVWRRRAWSVAAMAACLAAGFLLSPTLSPAPERLIEGVAHIVAVAPPETTFVSLPELEQQAEQAGDAERARIYFVAGRRYGAEHGDWHSAMRCYQQALDAAPQEVERINPKTDDWLLIALKIERQKEKDDAIRNE